MPFRTMVEPYQRHCYTTKELYCYCVLIDNGYKILIVCYLKECGCFLGYHGLIAGSGIRYLFRAHQNSYFYFLLTVVAVHNH